jgi:hypothetical protein
MFDDSLLSNKDPNEILFLVICLHSYNEEIKSQIEKYVIKIQYELDNDICVECKLDGLLKLSDLPFVKFIREQAIYE